MTKIRLQKWGGENFFRVEFGLHWVMCSLDGALYEKGKDFSCAPTQNEIDRAVSMVRNAIDMNYRTEGFYVRFGNIPKSGKSKNHATKRTEPGVSVISAHQDLSTGDLIVENYGSPSFFSVMDRPLYEISGLFVGVGSDGEPVLKNAQIVKQIEGEFIIE